MRFQDRLNLQLADHSRKHQEVLLQRDLKINLLERKVLEQETRYDRD